MSSPVAVIGLTVGGTDVQVIDGIFLQIVRGLNESPEVRGIDTIVPGLAGRIARNRKADRLVIELRGHVMGAGTAAVAAETAGGFATTLAADTVPGATTVVVADATGIDDAELARVGDTGETEIRAVADVTGTTVTLTAPLVRAHDTGDVVRQVDGLGSSGDRADFRTNAKIVRALFDPTALRVVVAALEDGTTATITARGLPGQLWDQDMPEFASVSIEMEAVADWVIT